MGAAPQHGTYVPPNEINKAFLPTSECTPTGTQTKILELMLNKFTALDS